MLNSSWRRGFIFGSLFSACWNLSAATEAHALGEIPFALDVDSLVSSDVVNAIVNLVGVGFQHRPYEPATPLGVAVGVDFSVEATLVKVPDSFFTTLADSGFPLGGSPIPSLPMPRLHLHKGFGELVDIGGSALYLLGNKVLGADVKIVLLQGEEGPTYAIRFCYTYSDLKISSLNVSTKTFAPQFLMSRHMDFADPYLGVGLEYAMGTLDASYTPSAADLGLTMPDGSPIPDGTPLPDGVEIPTLSMHKTGRSYGAQAFGGVSLKVPRSGLRITIEGSYNTAGTSTLGVKSGFTF